MPILYSLSHSILLSCSYTSLVYSKVGRGNVKVSGSTRKETLYSARLRVDMFIGHNKGRQQPSAHLKYANAWLRKSTPLTYWPTSAKQNLVTSQLPLILDLRTRGLGSIIRDNQRVSQYPKMFRHPWRRRKGHSLIVLTDKYTSLNPRDLSQGPQQSVLWYRNITRCHSSHTQYHKAWHLGVTWTSIGYHKESRGFAECHKMICVFQLRALLDSCQRIDLKL